MEFSLLGDSEGRAALREGRGAPKRCTLRELQKAYAALQERHAALKELQETEAARLETSMIRAGQAGELEEAVQGLQAQVTQLEEEKAELKQTLREVRRQLKERSTEKEVAAMEVRSPYQGT